MYKRQKTILNELINQAEGLDLTVYTKESVERLNAALKTAREVMEDRSLSVDDQIEVDEAAAVLRSAIAGLEETSGTTADGSGDGNHTGSTGGDDNAGSAFQGNADRRNEDAGIPKTGDEASGMLPMAGMAASIILLITAAVICKKKHK